MNNVFYYIWFDFLGAESDKKLLKISWISSPTQKLLLLEKICGKLETEFLITRRDDIKQWLTIY